MPRRQVRLAQRTLKVPASMIEVSGRGRASDSGFDAVMAPDARRSTMPGSTEWINEKACCMWATARANRSVASAG